MPTTLLRISAELENIEKLVPCQGNVWKFDISNGRGEEKAGVTIDPNEDIELVGSRGTANFVMKWPGENKQSYIKVVPVKKVTGEYSASSSGLVPVLGLECRGIEILRWIPSVDFVAISTGGKKFDEVDLSDDWADYDDDNDDSVSVMNLSHDLVSA
jgi:hypothetical protein